MKEVYVARTPHDKDMQRALLQWRNPAKRRLVMEALKTAGREDLIGYGPECLIRPDRPVQGQKKAPAKPKNGEKAKPAKDEAPAQKPAKLKRGEGWAKPKPKKNVRSGGKKR